MSVGIPVYNGEPYLAEALDSVLAQDYRNLEIILSDDASTDSSPDICRRYAAMDRRIRFHRNPQNLGGVRNFARVLAEATGTYFTWLAQDDLLSNPEYVKLTVDVLERHPDVVLCASGMNGQDYEGPGSRTLWMFPEISPDRSWRQARLCFFRWPPTFVMYAFYGMYRREALARVPIVETRYKNQPVVPNFEYAILTPLTVYGRIVSLPQALRSYRYHEGSHGARLRGEYSGLDKAVLGLRLKARLLRIAVGFPAPLAERCELVRVALKNFLTHTFVWTSDYPVELQRLEGEAAMLQGVAEERLALIDRLNEEIEARRRIIEGLNGAAATGAREGVGGAVRAPGVADKPVAPIDGSARAPRRPGVGKTRHAVHRLASVFRRPTGGERARCVLLRSEQIPGLRKLCEERLATINRLHAEAEALLRTMEILQGRDSPGAEEGHPQRIEYRVPPHPTHAEDAR